MKLSDLYFDLTVRTKGATDAINKFETFVNNKEIKVKLNVDKQQVTNALSGLTTGVSGATASVEKFGESFKAILAQLERNEKSATANFAGLMKGIAVGLDGVKVGIDNVVAAIGNLGNATGKSKGDVFSLTQALDRLKKRRDEIKNQKGSLMSGKAQAELNQIEHDITMIESRITQLGRMQGRIDFKNTTTGQAVEALKQQEREQRVLNSLKEKEALLQERLYVAMAGGAVNKNSYAGKRAEMEATNKALQREIELASVDADMQHKLALAKARNAAWNTNGKALAEEERKLALKRQEVELEQRIEFIKQQIAWYTNGTGNTTTKEQERLNMLRKIAEMQAKIELQKSPLGRELRKLTEEYNKLTGAVNSSANAKKREADTTEKAAASQNRLRRATFLTTAAAREQSVVLSQLSAYMGMYFSVYGAVHFLQSMVRVTGELEKQQVALKAIVQSSVQGEQLFSQYRSLALQSPFTAFDLIKSGKQLSAYQIPTNDLFDTTRRLSDLSAGLGVDVNRLILAYGQVYTASVLRGQELRQFTEAGLPMVDALAKKFTEIEGHVVTAGEVFDKISKRQVPFEMVKEVLFDLTDQGGKFYQMQQKQAESLAGKVQVLQDAWQMLLYDLGNSNKGALKGFVDGLQSIVRNFQQLLPLLKGVAWAYMVQVGRSTALRMALGREDKALMSNLALEAKRRGQFLKTEKNLRTLSHAERVELRSMRGMSPESQRVMRNQAKEWRAKADALRNKAGRSGFFGNFRYLPQAAMYDARADRMEKRLRLTWQNMDKDGNPIFGKRTLGDRLSYWMTGMSRYQLPYKDLSSMISKGELGAGQLKKLYFSGKIDGNAFKGLAKELNMTEKAISKAMRIERFPKIFQGVARGASLAGMAIKSFGASLAALAMDPMMWIMAIVGGFMAMKSHADAGRESVEALANAQVEAAKEVLNGLKEINKAYDHLIDAALKGSLPDAEMQKLVENLKGELEKILPDQSMLNNIVDSDDGLKEKIKRLNDLKKATQEAQEHLEALGGVKYDEGGPLSDSTMKNMLDGYKEWITTLPYIPRVGERNGKLITQDVRKFSAGLNRFDNQDELKDAEEDIRNKVNAALEGVESDLAKNSLIDQILQQFLSSEEWASASDQAKTYLSLFFDTLRPEQFKYQEGAKVMLAAIKENLKGEFEQMEKEGGEFNKETLEKWRKENPDGWRKMLEQMRKDAGDYFNQIADIFNQDLIINVRYQIKGQQTDPNAPTGIPALDDIWDGKYHDRLVKVYGNRKTFYSKVGDPTGYADYESGHYKRKKEVTGEKEARKRRKVDTKEQDKEIDLLKDLEKEYGLKDTSGKGGRGGRGGHKEDTWLDNLRNRFDLVKEAISEYENMATKIGETKAIDEVVKAFNLTETEKNKYLKHNGLKDLYEDYIGQLAGVANTKQRKDLLSRLRRGLGSTEMGILAEQLARDTETLEREISLAKDAFSRYEKLFQLTGNYSYSRRLAGLKVNYNGQTFNGWEDTNVFGTEKDDKRFSWRGFLISNFSKRYGVGLNSFLTPKYLEVGQKELVKILKEEGFKNEEQMAKDIHDFAKDLADMDYNAFVSAVETWNKQQPIDKQVKIIKDNTEDRARAVLDAIMQDNTFVDKNGVEISMAKALSEWFHGDEDKLREYVRGNSILIEAVLREGADDVNAALVAYWDKTNVLDDLLSVGDGPLGWKQSQKYIDKLEGILKNAVAHRDANGFVTGYTIDVDGKQVEVAVEDVEELQQALDKLRGTYGSNNKFKHITHLKKVLNLGEMFNTKTGKMEKLTAGQRATLESELADTTAAIINQFSEGVDAVGKFFEAFGSEDAQAAVSTMTQLAEGVANVVASAMKKDYIGAAIAGVATLGTLIGNIINAGDAAISRRIERLQWAYKLYENIQADAERTRNRTLGEVVKDDADVYNYMYDIWRARTNDTGTKTRTWFDGMFGDFDMAANLREFNFPGLDKYYEYLLKLPKASRQWGMELVSLQEERDNLQSQLAEEDSRKASKRDQSVIADLQNRIGELDDKIKNYVRDWAKDLWDIDLKGWADQFGDALVNAFVNGESAAKAFRNTVGSIMQDLVKKFITLKVIEPALQGLDNYLFGEKDGVLNDFDLSEQDLIGMAPWLKNLEGAIDVGNDIFKTIQAGLERYGFSMKASDRGGLSAGIQNITEDTADLLASYLNAIRAAVEYIRMSHEQRDSQGNMLAESQLQQLRMIQANTMRNADAADEIKALFSSVISTGSSGKRIRVA